MFNPTTNGLVLSLEATDGVVTDANGNVIEWRDQSGLGNHVTGNGITAVTRSTEDGTIVIAPEGGPRIDQPVGVTPTGVQAISLDGANDFFKRLDTLNGFPGGNQDRTMFMTVRYDDVDSFAGAIYGQPADNKAFGLIATSRNPANAGVIGFGRDNDLETERHVEDVGWFTHSVVLKDGFVEVYINGIKIDEHSHVYDTVLRQFVIGQALGGARTNEMSIASVQIYDRALSGEERGEVEAYLQDKYLGDPVNDAPHVAPDDASIGNGETVFIDILNNDTDDRNDFDPSTIEIVEAPVHGEIVSIDTATGVVEYRHNGLSQPDTFVYRVADGDGNVSSLASVDITVDGASPFTTDGFEQNDILTVGDVLTSIAFLPDNRMLVMQKSGVIQIVDPESGASSVYMDLSDQVEAGRERGMLDFTLDPDFENNGYFYVYYTPKAPERATISRFTHQENTGGLTSTASGDSELVLWRDEDIYDSDGDGDYECCHYGGGLDFGPDGKLWLTTGDKFNTINPGEGEGEGDVPADLSSTSGKIIRINADAPNSYPDGSDGTPANPYITPGSLGPNGEPAHPSIWAYGLRNPFRARWDDEYGNLYIGEVGGNQLNKSSDSIHLASLDQPGVNYGWPFYEGVENTRVNEIDPNNFLDDLPPPDGDLGDPANGDYYSAPIYSYDRAQGASITGGEVYRGDALPEFWNGVYLFGDYTRDTLTALRLDQATGTIPIDTYEIEVDDPFVSMTYLTVGNDGYIYYTLFVDDGVNSGTPTSILGRLTYEDLNEAPQVSSFTATPIASQSLTIEFSAAVSDANGDALQVTVNYGDGASDIITPDANGLFTIQHTYADDGFYNAAISVTDGQRTALSAPVEVIAGDPNFPPQIANFQSSLTFPDLNEEVVFTAVATDQDGDALTYLIDFGDGNTQSGNVGANGEISLAHAYAEQGSYFATLEVFDGQTSVQTQQLNIRAGEVTNIGVTDGLVFAVEANIKYAIDENFVVTGWLDSSGNGNNLSTQGDPIWVDNATPSGQPAIIFDGDGDVIERVDSTETPINGLPTGDSARALFFIVNYGDPEGVYSGFSYGNDARNQAFGLTLNGGGEATGAFTLQAYGATHDNPSDVVAQPYGWIVQSVVVDENGDFQHFINGQEIDSGNHQFNTTLERIAIGGEIGNAGESELAVSAVYMYNRALTIDEREQVESFLQRTYITPPANEPPTAVGDTYAGIEDRALSVDAAAGLLANDVDPDGDSLIVSEINGVAVSDGETVNLSNGALTINQNGSFSFSPDTDFVGEQSFSYAISDGAGGVNTATATLAIASGAAPLAGDDAYFASQDTNLSVNALNGLLANDTDANGDALTVTHVNGVAIPVNGVVALAAGTLTVSANGAFSFEPAQGFVGEQQFEYTVSDGVHGEDTGLARIRVEAQGNSDPLPVDGLVLHLRSDENLVISPENEIGGWIDTVLGNDLDVIGEPTLVENATPTGEDAVAFDGVNDALYRDGGLLSGFAAGSDDRTIFIVVDYDDPNGVYAGVAYGDGARNETFGLFANPNTNTLGVQGWGGRNDYTSGADALDNDGDQWLVQSAVLSDNVLNHYLDGALIDTQSHTYNTDLGAATSQLIIGGEIAGLGFSDMNIASVIIYNRALSEEERLTVEAHLQEKYITGAPPPPDNTAPVAAADAYQGVENSTTTADAATGLLANDSDADGDVLSVTQISGVALPANGEVALDNGVITVSPNGAFNYTPNAEFFGEEQFTYTVSDGTDTNQASVVITIEEDTPPPPAGPPVTSGLVVHLETDQNVTQQAGAVTGWGDGTSFGHDLTAIGDPRLIAGGTPTGEAAIAFDGSDDALSLIGGDNLTALPDGSEDRTIFIVVDYVDPNGIYAGVAYGDGARNEAFGLVSTNTDRLAVQGWGMAFDAVSTVPTGDNQGNDEWLVQSAVLSDDALVHYLDGELIDSQTRSFNTDTMDADSQFVIGAEIAGLGYGELNIAAVLVYDRALSDTERAQVEDYLAQKYISDDGLLA